MEIIEQKESKLSKIIWLDEFCENMGIAQKTGRRMVKQRKIAHIKAGTKIGFLPEHIDEFLQMNSVPALVKPELKVDAAVSEMKNKILQKRKA